MEPSATTTAATALAGFSDDLAGIVEAAAPSVVRVDDGSRLTASGTVWSADGLIVATSHGVERDEDLAVVLHDGTRHAATVVGRDPDTDVVLLQVTGVAGLTPLPVAAAETVRVGQIAIALGRPGESGLIATIGIVSVKRDTQTQGHDEYILNTDADLFPGVSGGPLLNARGELLGLLDRLYGRGLGVALGAPLVARVAETLRQHGRIPRGYLGIRTQLVEIPAAHRTEGGATRGLLIVNVEPGSPAEQGGLLLGDTVLTIAGDAADDVDTLRRHLHAAQPVELSLLRAGQILTLSPTVGAAAA